MKNKLLVTCINICMAIQLSASSTATGTATPPPQASAAAAAAAPSSTGSATGTVAPTTTSSSAATAAMPPEEENQSFLSSFWETLKTIPKISSKFIFGKDVNDEYWEIYRFHEKLEAFKKLVNSIKATNYNAVDLQAKEIISNILKELNQQHLIAQQLLFDKYNDWEKNMLRTGRMSARISITSCTTVPTTDHVMITTPHQSLGRTIDSQSIPNRNLSGLTDNDKNNIENTWLLSMKKLNNLEYGGNLVESEIIENFRLDNLQLMLKYLDEVQKFIHETYKKDFNNLREIWEKLAFFIVTQKFQNETSSVEAILYDVKFPNNVEIIYRSDDATTITAKYQKFEDNKL